MDTKLHIFIHPNEITWEFVRSSGPGGQNVNKVATAVQLRFNVDRSSSLTDTVKLRLKKIAGNRVTRGGELIIIARKYSTQLQNREDAMRRLNVLIKKALEIPKSRRKTRPSEAACQRRIDAKVKQKEKKLMRRAIQMNEKHLEG